MKKQFDEEHDKKLEGYWASNDEDEAVYHLEPDPEELEQFINIVKESYEKERRKG